MVSNMDDAKDDQGIAHNRRKPVINDYQIFMLRVWPPLGAQFESEDEIRLSLEHVTNGQRIGFTNWESLITYLRKQTHRE